MVQENRKEVESNICWHELIRPKNRGTNENGEEKSNDFTGDTFHYAVGPVLRIGQWFGILPVTGILEKEAEFLRFEWFSVPMGHCLLLMTGGAFLSILSFRHMAQKGFNVDNAGMLIFYGSAFLAQVLFLRLARFWPELSREMARVERLSVLLPHHLNDGNMLSLKTMLNCWSFIILSLALVEHGMCIMSGVAYAYNCAPYETIAMSHYISAFPQVFSWAEYAHWKAMFLQLMNLAATFTWNFMDLFIVLVSIGLTYRFDQLNKVINTNKGKDQSMKFWYNARNEYTNICQLVKKVDGAINGIIMLSFSQNLYIICKQLFNSLKYSNTNPAVDCVKNPEGLFGGMAPTIYFSFSFSFLVARFLTVALFAAGVHHCSRVPIGALYYVSPQSYCLEVQRFLDLVITESVALTGLNFFHISRDLILTIASTVVTYELVLVQFYMPRHDYCFYPPAVTDGTPDTFLNDTNLYNSSVV